jgi:glycosyltransferase involved in cell wall biosynthesis
MVGGAQRKSEQSYFRSLELQIQQLGLEGRVRLLGQRSDVSTLLSAADIHCQPNIGPEPFGRTFIEGLAAGLPVVTMNIGAAAEIVDPSCGILVRPGDPPELARSLKLLIQSPARRAELGANGVSRASELCDPKRQMAKFVETLRAGLQ